MSTSIENVATGGSTVEPTTSSRQFGEAAAADDAATTLATARPRLWGWPHRVDRGRRLARPDLGPVATYRDTGVVLRTIRLGEADRIVTIITAGHGKVRAVAKGVRKVKSRIGARLEPLTHIDMMCWRGRDLDIVTQVEVIDVFRGIRSDLTRLGPAMTMLEIVDQVTVDHQGSPALYTLLVGALRSLELTGSPVTLAAFCLRLLAVEGVGPITDSCAHCGSSGPLVAFDPGEGGFLCHSCRRGQPVSPEVVALTQRICSGGLARALSEPGGPTVDALERLATSAVEHHLDRRLRTTRHHLAEETTSA